MLAARHTVARVPAVQSPLRALIVSAEAVPYAKSGGLGDVVGALAPELRDRGVDVRLLLPLYGWIGRDRLVRLERGVELRLPQVLRCAIWHDPRAAVPTYLVEHERAYAREHIYGPPGEAYPDNGYRFAVLCRAALALSGTIEWWPDVFHVNDWPTALLPIYLNQSVVGRQSESATLLTIHNLGYQGVLAPVEAASIGVSELGVEADGRAGTGVNLLASAIRESSLLSTVSPTYAREIQTSAHGDGLDPLLRQRGADLIGRAQRD